MTTEPATYEHGLGEILRAHRLYIGLSQRDMSDRLRKDRRDYQRIENGRDACPPGLLTTVKEMVDAFDHAVDHLIEQVKRQATNDGVDHIRVSVTPADEWQRLVAGCAAVLAYSDDELPRISLTLVEDQPNERSA